MSLTVKALNGDTAFLFTFNPPPTSPSSTPDPQRSFTILVDPWLVGAATILSSVFSISERKSEPCISSLKELDHEPDIILISQAKPDHCHEETLRQLPADCQSTILATPAAAKKIRSWRHFRPELVQDLPRYDQADSRSIYRLALPPLTPRGSCGEVTIAWIPAKRDISGVHHAIGITYRPSCSESPSNLGRYLELPMSPPASPGSPITISSSPRTIVPSPNNDRERTLSVIYSPHGVPWDTIRPYATSHLVNEAALPLSVFLHSFDCVENPWYLGGNISAGSPGGFQIARSLYAKSWISAHDADKDNRGISVKQVRIGKYTVNEIKRMLQQGQPERKGFTGTNLVTLGSGDEHKVEIG